MLCAIGLALGVSSWRLLLFCGGIDAEPPLAVVSKPVLWHKEVRDLSWCPSAPATQILQSPLARTHDLLE